jgi:uncharacterized OsmC-like protein
MINGINVPALEAYAGAVAKDKSQGIAEFGVTTRWTGGTRMESKASSYTLAGQKHARDFTIVADEPLELLGQNSAPNPQELLMSAMNSCMMVGYVANAALMGIELESLSIETRGELDLRGFLGLSDTVVPGNPEIRYCIRVKSKAPAEKLKALHEIVIKTSPNRWNIAQPVKLVSELIVE